MSGGGLRSLGRQCHWLPRCVRAASAPARGCACGARSRMRASNFPARSAGMSAKKNEGALSGMRRQELAAADCRRSASTVTRSARPKPSDSTTVGVSAPGRWILAMASRATGECRRGRRRAICHRSTVATRRSSTNTAAAATTKMAAIRLVIGLLDRERCQRATNQHRRHDIGPAWPALFAGHLRRGTASMPPRHARGRAAISAKATAVSRP